MADKPLGSGGRPNRDGEGGFVLAIAIILVVVLTISGTSFLQHSYLELRLAATEQDRQQAFYLAHTGLDRARAVAKIPEDHAWTFVLDGTYDEDGNGEPDYPVDSKPPCLPGKPPRCLCPPQLSRGCAIPPFQAAARRPELIKTSGVPVAAPDLPFDETFAAGDYTVRIFNNEPDVADTDQQVTVRALGTIRGQQKLLEATIQATSALGIANCLGERGTPCPTDVRHDFELAHRDNREPRTVPELPALNRAFYSQPRNFPWIEAVFMLTGDVELTLEDGEFYFVDGDVSIRVADASNVVVFSTGDIRVKGDVQLSDAILVALGEIRLQGNVVLSAPAPSPPYPAAAAVEGIRIEGPVEVSGPVYSGGAISWNGGALHGLLIGAEVLIGDLPSTMTDGGESALYELMPGFDYPYELRTAVVVPGTWRTLD
jgi:hypothetical protein